MTNFKNCCFCLSESVSMIAQKSLMYESSSLKDPGKELEMLNIIGRSIRKQSYRAKSSLIRPNLDGRLSALPPFDVIDGKRSTKSRQFKSLLEKD